MTNCERCGNEPATARARGGELIGQACSQAAAAAQLKKLRASGRAAWTPPVLRAGGLEWEVRR